MLKKISAEKTFLSVTIAQVSLLFILAIFSGRQLVLDESYLLRTVSSLAEDGLSRQFLFALSTTTGPLYAFVHFIFSPISGLQAPGLRIINLCFLIITIAATAFALKAIKQDSYWKHALLLMCMPYIYVVAGLALTDMPAMAFCSLALAFGAYCLQTPGWKGWLASCLSGICWSAALIGRQTYLPAVLALIVFILREPRLRMKVLSIMLIALLPLGVLISIWQGLVPPSHAFFGKGFSLEHLILGFAYAGILVFFIYPHWFGLRWKRLAILLALGYVLNAMFSLVRFSPFLAIVSRLLTPDYLGLYTYLAGGLMLGIALVTVFGLIRYAWRVRGETLCLYFVIATIGILLANIKLVFQFSSRYCISIAPLLVLMTVPYVRYNRFLVLRALLAGIAGFISLSTYLGIF